LGVVAFVGLLQSSKRYHDSQLLKKVDFANVGSSFDPLRCPTDLDGDGEADLISRRISIGTFPEYVSPEFRDKYPKAKVMPPELRKYATGVLQARTDFEYFIAKDKLGEGSE